MNDEVKNQEPIDREKAGTGLKGTSIGYAVELTMDYGNGRQMRISGTLPLGATAKEFNEELDKLRIATNRQQAFIIVMSRKAQLEAEKKVIASLKFQVEEYEKTMNEQLEKAAKDPKANLTINGQQRKAMQLELENFKRQKLLEINQHQGEVDICEVIIAKAKEEIGED